MLPDSSDEEEKNSSGLFDRERIDEPLEVLSKNAYAFFSCLVSRV